MVGVGWGRRNGQGVRRPPTPLSNWNPLYMGVSATLGRAVLIPFFFSASTSPKFTQQTSSSPRLEVTQQLSSPKITQQAASSPLEVTQLPSSPKITQQAASLSPKFTQQTLYKSSSQRFTQQALYKSWSPKFTQQALSLTPKFTQQALSSPSKITQQTVSPKFTHQPGPSPPKFTQQPTWPKQTYYDEDGPPIILDCNIKADDSVTILWFKDDQPLSNAMFSYPLQNDTLEWQGLHRFEKYLNIQDCLEKSLKIKSASISTRKSLKALKSP